MPAASRLRLKTRTISPPPCLHEPRMRNDDGTARYTAPRCRGYVTGSLWSITGIRHISPRPKMRSRKYRSHEIDDEATKNRDGNDNADRDETTAVCGERLAMI